MYATVYWLECENSVIYVGRTNSPDKRIRKHFSGGGSQITKTNKPLRVLAQYEVESNISSRCEWDAVKHCERMFPNMSVYGGGRTS